MTAKSKHKLVSFGCFSAWLNGVLSCLICCAGVALLLPLRGKIRSSQAVRAEVLATHHLAVPLSQQYCCSNRTSFGQATCLPRGPCTIWAFPPELYYTTLSKAFVVCFWGQTWKCLQGML